MRIFKKGIALILVLTLVLGLMPVLAMADDEPSIVLKPTAQFVKAGDSFQVEVYLKAGSSAMSVAGMELYFTYDESKVSVAVDENTYSYFTKAGKVNQWSLETGVTTKGLVVVAGATANSLVYLIPQPDEEILLGSLNFQALSEISTGTIEFGLNQDFSQGNKYGLSTDKANIITSSENKNYEADFSKTASVNVVSTGVSLSQYKVTVDGLKGASVNATAFDASVNDITGSVTWSVDPQNRGVSISGSTITVDAKAKSDNYTITATGNDSIFGEGQNSAFAMLSVARAESVPSKIEGNEPGAGFDANLEIPADNVADKTVQFSINVWDQYGDLIENPQVKWELLPNNVPGVSLSNDGLLTITNEAKTSIDTTGTQFTINAYCGELGPVTTVVTVKRADPVATSVEIYKGEEVVTSDSVAIPTGDTANEVTYSAKVLDQYGGEITGASVMWSNDNSLSGVAVSNNTVTVAKDATAGNFTLKAESGSVNTSLVVNIVTIAFEGQDTAVSTVDSPIYGMTWGEIIKVNDSAISAKVGETQVEGTYSVENADTIPDAGNSVEYRVIFTSNDGNYVGVEVARGTVEIAQKPVTVSGITANDKVYDGTTVAELNTDSASIGGKVGNDDVTIDVANATGTFDTKNVGTGKTVTITDITLGGNDAGNYTLSSDSATATADITAKTVTVSGITASNKVYDGNTSATIETSGAAISDIVGNDDVTIDVANATGTFDTKNVGTDKTVTITGIALGGADKDNYTLTSDSANATASITASSNINASVNETQNVVVGVGDFTEPTFTGVTVNGVAETVAGTVTYTIGDNSGMDYYAAKTALAQKTKGTEVAVDYSFTPTDSNYTGNITGTINVTMVDIAFTGVEEAITVATDAVYGDTWGDIVTVDASKITAKVGDTEIKDGTYTVKDASVMPDAGTATWVVQFTGTLGDKTYTNVTVATGTVDVAQKVLTISGISAEDKEYNGNTDATVTGTATLNGVLEGDTVTVTDGAAEFASKNAGQQTVTFSGFSIEGNGASNYTLIQPAPVIATISPKSVTIENVAVSDKTYDGNRDATIANSGTISGIISSDNVTIQSGTGTFASADVGTGITVTFSSFSLSGDDAGNYTLSAQPASTTADITKANYTGTPNTVNVNVLINQSAAQTGSVSIDQFFQTIPAGAVITSVAPASGSVMDSVAVEDGVIKYSSKANLETENVTDTYTVTIATQNYNNITATLTFTTVAKTPVNISGVSVTGAGKTYDGKAVSYTGTPAAKTNDGKTVAVTGTYSYVWQKADGTVLASAPKDAGIYKLVITLDDPAYIGSAEVSFTIAKAKITITAEDAEAYTGSDMPKLSYTVTGLATGEKLAKEPSVSCAADMKKAGSYVIAVSGAEVPNTNNYEETITYVSGTLEVKNRPVNIGPTYDIKVLDSAHGTVRASLGNASEGSTIRLTVTPDEGYSLANLIVRDERGRRIDVAKSGGVYRFVMPAGDVTIEAVFAQGTTVLPFTDVSTYDWFYEYVKYVYDNGIMDGIDVGVFGPGITTTRAMLVTMLYRVAGEPYVSGTNDFADVAANTWYTDAVTWASKNGIVTGVDVGVFNPNGAITREQLATILYRYAEYVGEDVSARASLSRFTDTGSISAYARDAMSWAVAEGILDGRTATELAPTGECTRAEVATMIARAFG